LGVTVCEKSPFSKGIYFSTLFRVLHLSKFRSYFHSWHFLGFGVLSLPLTITNIQHSKLKKSPLKKGIFIYSQTKA
ncbi:MAG: hypothetical protein LBM93_10315, partial [Oscillospiraceae bacterium]|nr:hypothetical protein [Oscillospiraceae bacterium]